MERAHWGALSGWRSGEDNNSGEGTVGKAQREGHSREGIFVRA